MANDPHLAIGLDRGAVVRHIGAIEDDPGNRNIAGAQGFQRQQGMVDRAQSRAADKYRGQAQVHNEIND